MRKSSIFFYNILYIAKVPVGSGSGEHFSHPYSTKKVRFRPDPQLCLRIRIRILKAEQDPGGKRRKKLNVQIH